MAGSSPPPGGGSIEDAEEGAVPVYLVTGHQLCSEIMGKFPDEFSSNPFQDGRLLALRTMTDSQQHLRCLRIGKPFYSSTAVNTKIQNNSWIGKVLDWHLRVAEEPRS